MDMDGWGEAWGEEGTTPKIPPFVKEKKEGKIYRGTFNCRKKAPRVPVHKLICKTSDR